MHLSFDSLLAKHRDNKVQDQSGNRNDAGLANGAEISNRTMGRERNHVLDSISVMSINFPEE